jgi:hypothetical protein
MPRLVSGGEFGAAVGQRVTKCDVVEIRGIGSDFDDVLMVPCEIVSKFLGDALMALNSADSNPKLPLQSILCTT